MSDYSINIAPRTIATVTFEILDYPFSVIYAPQNQTVGLLSPTGIDFYSEDMENILSLNFLEAFYRAKKVAYLFVAAQIIDDVCRRWFFSDKLGRVPSKNLDTNPEIVLWWIEGILGSPICDQIIEERIMDNLRAIKDNFYARPEMQITEIAPRPDNNIKHDTKAGYVYLLKSSEGLFKIGHTKRPSDRLHTFEVKLPYRVQYEHLIYTLNRRKLEQELHQRFSSQRLDGEWFRLSDEDVEYIKSIHDEIEPNLNDLFSLPLFNHLKPTDDR